MPLNILRQDITQMKVDAIVNAANAHLKRGGGVCGAIFDAAGAEQLQRACDRIGHCPTGQAVLTKGYRLPAAYIIHTVGPVWQGGNQGEQEALIACYRNSLALAKKKGIKSVAFPLISSGIFGYPKDQALSVAVSAIGNFLLHEDMMVYLVVYDRSAYAFSDRLFQNIAAYIDQSYVDAKERLYGRSAREKQFLQQLRESAPSPAELERFNVPDMAPTCPSTRDFSAVTEEKAGSEPSTFFSRLKDVLGRRREGFSAALMGYIDQKQLKDSQVYKRANLDRKLFSKIRSNPNYHPSKNTALALAVALELNLDQTRDLLALAGWALSPSSRFDLIVQYFIQEGNYNIFEINEALFAFDEGMLGG